MVTLGSLPIHYRLGNALVATTKYLQQTIWPLNLSAFYPHTWSSFPVWRVAGALTFIIALSVICVLNLRRRPYLAVGWAWYLITLLPVVGIIQVGSQAHADRYTYVPLIGIFIMVSWYADELISRWHISRRTMLVSAASLLGIMLTLTAAQTFVWKDNLTLFKNAYSFDTENPVALQNIGDEYMKRDQFQNAFAAYLKAMQFGPYFHLTHFKMGNALEKMNRPSEALHFYQNARRLKPDLLIMDQKIGGILVRMGRYDEAEPYIQRVIQRGGSNWSMSDPVDPQTSRLDWAIILASRNRIPEALDVMEGVLGKDSKSSKARVMVGLALLQVGRPKEALQQIEIALMLNPRDPGMLYHKGLVLTYLNRFSEARQTFEKLKEVEPNSPQIHKGMLELEMAQTKAARGALQVGPS
jgi:tetratricopeptide (TPR) repeat protein